MFYHGEIRFFHLLYHFIQYFYFNNITLAIYIIVKSCFKNKDKKGEENINLDEEVNLKNNQFIMPRCIKTFKIYVFDLSYSYFYNLYTL